MILKFFDDMKKKIDKKLEKMGQDNKKNFGEGKLDCCGLNQKNQPSPKGSSK
ncbi:hypothetical protein QO008_000383 [Peptoniphilus ivorii]|uniref:LDCC motif putative metal-binding protein n=1 Tax=Aedoeadaptatus ivorii TaxID=54006 RepID=UPI0013DE8D45|nr:LDCC motif putative metal-binding protein [Peptoniphilus ivorii]MDQ0507939.1 hypothetical protein [Peptoniphilus ivorii]